MGEWLVAGRLPSAGDGCVGVTMADVEHVLISAGCNAAGRLCVCTGRPPPVCPLNRMEARDAACTHYTRTHTHIHTHAHTYTHLHTHMFVWWFLYAVSAA